MVARERICVTEDGGMAVPANHPLGVSLLVGEGGTIDDDQARRYGIVDGLLPRDGDGQARPSAVRRVRRRGPGGKFEGGLKLIRQPEETK